MKRIYILIAVCTILFVDQRVFAQSATPKSTTTPTIRTTAAPTKKVDSQVEDLKERLATKVAELRQSAPKAIHGVVSQVTVSTLTVDAQNKAIKIELTDDITVVQMLKNKRTILTTDDIDKDDRVTIFGDYDATIDILKAKTIFIESKTSPIRLHGFVASTDKSKNTIALTGVDGQTYTLDIETSTKTQEWKRQVGFEKSGFSKIVPGMFLSVFGTPDADSDTTISALRILAIQTVEKPTPTTALTPEAEEKEDITPTPTKKATPTKKPTPTPEE